VSLDDHDQEVPACERRINSHPSLLPRPSRAEEHGTRVTYSELTSRTSAFKRTGREIGSARSIDVKGDVTSLIRPGETSLSRFEAHGSYCRAGGAGRTVNRMHTLWPWMNLLPPLLGGTFAFMCSVNVRCDRGTRQIATIYYSCVMNVHRQIRDD
jgi:hypothetical protein